jgi:hypothetical protein
MPSKRSSDDASGHAYLQVAEAEGNRTPLTEVLGHNGFEDRAAHQDGYASSGSPVMIPSKATAAESSSELQCYLRLRPTTIGSVRVSRPPLIVTAQVIFDLSAMIAAIQRPDLDRAGQTETAKPAAVSSGRIETPNTPRLLPRPQL